MAHYFQLAIMYDSAAMTATEIFHRKFLLLHDSLTASFVVLMQDLLPEKHFAVKSISIINDHIKFFQKYIIHFVIKI